MIPKILSVVLISFVLCSKTFAIDPFDIPQLIPRGPLKGKVIDTSMRRSLVILTAAQLASIGKTQAENELWVANVRHQGKFWVAQFPMTAITKQIFLLEHFAAPFPAAHAMMRYLFEGEQKPTLYSQDNFGLANYKPEVITLDDFVTSVEAAGPAGSAYSFMDGMRSRMGLAYRMISTEEKGTQGILERAQPVEQFPLNLSPKELEASLRTYIEHSHKRKMKDMYHTIIRNCTIVQVNLLEKAVKFKYWMGRALDKVLVFAEFFPALSTVDLQWSGYRGRLKQIHNLNAEPFFAEKIKELQAQGKLPAVMPRPRDLNPISSFCGKALDKLGMQSALNR